MVDEVQVQKQWDGVEADDASMDFDDKVEAKEEQNENSDGEPLLGIKENLRSRKTKAKRTTMREMTGTHLLEPRGSSPLGSRTRGDARHLEELDQLRNAADGQSFVKIGPENVWHEIGLNPEHASKVTATALSSFKEVTDKV